MSLIYPSKAADVELAQPRLHAFVIGVANYPHMKGGAGAPALTPLGLGQVTTPLWTSLAIVNWLMTDYTHPDKSLGSIEFVASAGPADVVELNKAYAGVEPATMVNIVDAFERWQKRCASNPDNIAFFYFCGHGLQKAEQYLLAEDFGDPAVANAWKNSINFSATQVGMRACAAQTQFYFVDACRELPFALLNAISANGQTLMSASVGDSVNCSAVYYAAAKGAKAHGPRGGVSYFGQAVIGCLEGLAGISHRGRWIVTAASLSKSIPEVIEHYKKLYKLHLTCNSDVTGLETINVPGVGHVIALIDCTTAAASTHAVIKMTRKNIVYLSGLADPKPLVQIVEPGDWEVTVTFPSGAYPDHGPETCVLSPATFVGVNTP